MAMAEVTVAVTVVVAVVVAVAVVMAVVVVGTVPMSVAVSVRMVVVGTVVFSVDGTMVGEDLELLALSATDVGEATRGPLGLTPPLLILLLLLELPRLLLPLLRPVLLSLLLPLLPRNTADITVASSESRSTSTNISTHCHSFRRSPSIFRQFLASPESSRDEATDTSTATVSTIRVLVVSFVSVGCC